MPRPRAQEEKQVLQAYLSEHKLKRSEQREIILEEFLRAKRHVSVDELLRIVQRRRPDIGVVLYQNLASELAAKLGASLRDRSEANSLQS